jgi:uncharacterized membrane protein YgaE (UPF0421/DUF939 family)
MEQWRERLVRGISPVAQTAVASALSWYVARRLLGVGHPLFAPVAAMVALGISTGRRGRNALEVVVGVAFGVGVADTVARLLGHGALQIALVVAVAMTVALAVDEGSTFVLQAAISGFLVAAAPRPEGLVPDRFLEALIGGGVALVFSQLLFPVDPQQTVRGAVARLASAMEHVLDRAAAAVAKGDEAGLDAAVDDARVLGGQVEALAEALAVARPTVRHAPRRRRGAAVIERYGDAFRHLDLAANDLVSITRLLKRAGEAPAVDRAGLAALLGTLAGAVAPAVGETSPEALRDARTALVSAAISAHDARGLTSSAVSAQVDALVDDLLRASGLSARETRARLVGAGGAMPV